MTLREIEKSPLIKQKANALYRSALLFANPLIRNRATLGGNLCDASPASDTATPLMALGAEVQLSSKHGSRWVPLDEFFVHVRKTVRKPDELLTAVRWPLTPARSADTFYKLGLRKADAISVVSMGMFITLDTENKFSVVRIALGSVAPTPIRAYEAEKYLIGKSADEDVYTEAGNLAVQACKPISDVRATAEYRKEMAAVLVKRLLRESVKQIGA